ncbi:hypothetical protein D3C85_1662640 [compost metagenome]
MAAKPIAKSNRITDAQRYKLGALGPPIAKTAGAAPSVAPRGAAAATTKKTISDTPNELGRSLCSSVCIEPSAYSKLPG